MGDIRSIYNELHALLESGGLKKTLKAFRKESGFKAECSETKNDTDSSHTLADAVVSAIVAAREPGVELSQKNGVKLHNGSRAKKIVLKHKKKHQVEVQPSEDSAQPVESDSALCDKELRDAISPFVAAIEQHRTACSLSEPDEEAKPAASASPSSRRRKRPRISETAVATASGESQGLPKDPIPNGTRPGATDEPHGHSRVADAVASPACQQRRSSVNSQNGHSFKRIDESKFLKTIHDARLLDQSYKTKGGDVFASRAAEELGRVRGKDFKREMHKKKRASWRGAGAIDDTVNSIQFEDSD